MPGDGRPRPRSAPPAERGAKAMRPGLNASPSSAMHGSVEADSTPPAPPPAPLAATASPGAGHGVRTAALDLSSTMHVLGDVQKNMARSEQIDVLTWRMDAQEQQLQQQRRGHMTLESRVSRLEKSGSSASSGTSQAEIDPCKLEVRGFLWGTPKDKIAELVDLVLTTIPPQLNGPRNWQGCVHVVTPFVTGPMATLRFTAAELANSFLEGGRSAHGGYGCYYEQGGHKIFASTQRTQAQTKRSRVLYRCVDVLKDMADENLVHLDIVAVTFSYNGIKVASWRRQSESLEWKERGLADAGLVQHLAPLTEEELDAE
uniref:Uncharacterized protein n=1 Tax=Alexandrium monilatum TaxID=311494 RepID=A0A7S4SPR6_9DINO|mmetsp:Transcript_87011/g.269374  ORF Transcript_87011/g.269374 Transcript_87011/m.269374 type:complete len:316 (-) Transcript_87011:96-1043(-)